MNQDHISLLKSRFELERQARQIKILSISENNQQRAVSLLIRIEEKINNINQLLIENSDTDSSLDRVNQVAANLKSMANPNPKLPHVNDIPDSNPGSMFKIKEANGKIDPSTYDQYPDHEVQMARGDLYRVAKRAIMLHEILQRLDEKQGLEGWVQAKITKAADYIETVWHYLAYEMRFPGDEYGSNHNKGVGEATYGPGDITSPQQQATGSSGVAPAKPGEVSPTPPAGGATPSGGTPGMVKMSKLGPDKKPMGTPVMVRATDIAVKQKQGFAVIGEEVVENASAGASSAGGIAGNATGFASGGIGMQKRKKRVEGTMADAEKESTGPDFTGYYKGKDKGRPGKKMVGGQ